MYRKRLEVEDVGDIAVVSFIDRKIFDEQHIQRIGEQLFELIDKQRKKKIILDFGNVEYLASMAFGKLFTLNKKVQAATGRLVLCNMDSAIYEVCRAINFDKFFEIVQGKQEALQKLQQTQPARAR